MPTAIFQGTLVIPVFDTGRVLTPVVKSTPLQFLSGTGDQALVSYNSTDNFIGSNFDNASSVTLSYCDVELMTIAGNSRLTLGQKYIPSVSQPLNWAPGIMAYNNYTQSSWTFQGVAGNVAPMIPFPIAIPFVQTRVLTGTFQRISGLVSSFGGIQNFFQNSSSWEGSNQVNAQPIPPVSRAVVTLTVDGRGPMNVNALMQPAWAGAGNAVEQYSTPQTRIFGAVPSTFLADSSGLSNSIWSIPAPNSDATKSVNYIWRLSESGNGVVSIRTTRVALDAFNLSFEATEVSAYSRLTYDNASLNNATNQLYLPCANGVLFGWTNNNGLQTADYYVSADGTKYWLIEYANYGAKFTNSATSIPTIQNDGIPYAKYIDKSGVFWYIGSAVKQTNDNINVAYSFSEDLTFNQIYLPAIPPLSFPCWSACLDRIGGQPGTLTSK